MRNRRLIATSDKIRNQDNKEINIIIKRGCLIIVKDAVELKEEAINFSIQLILKAISLDFMNATAKTWFFMTNPLTC